MITDGMMEAACAATGHTLHPEDVRKALEAALKAAPTQAEEVTDEYLEKLWEEFSEKSDWEHTIPWTSFNRGYRWAHSELSEKISALVREKEALAAHQCLFLDGSGLTGDEGGTPVCLKAERLVEAELLIRELNNHEGAEGWSEYLSERLDKFYKDKAT